MNSLTKVAAEAPSRRSFRVTLREMTREDHDASERLFAPFMDDPGAYMAPFLAAQHAALSAIRDATARSDAREIAVILPDLIDRLAKDCADLSQRAPAVQATRPLSGLAGAYLVLGSQMGVDAMRVRATRAGIAPLPRFFQPTDRRSQWAAVCAKLGDVDPDSDAARRLIDDTRAGYALYAQAGRLTFAKAAT
ncbi:heme oxygenase-like domain-containing protein [Maritimibacter alexandrii]|uniref:biliverdin-producing heme oxygenase n=1 Tax=Maritimibacter alexandrii TaxID=2570355 RepID=UPI0011081BE5|nr:biliverdin-producing heme oxygenase [Maritimibacter alexandrii]